MTYRFVSGIDYGPRKGTLGIAVHMTEGSSAGAVSWLTRREKETAAQWRTRVRGVSANFVILADGEIVQMVTWGNASGSMNPADRSTDKTFYGRRFLMAVLGTHWTDPNAYSLSVEIAGYRATGPTLAQVDALASLVADARKRYPTLRGAYGHADQTDTKGCPGTAPLMQRAWTRIGHGLFPAALPDTATAEEAMKLTDIKDLSGTATLPDAWRVWRVADDVAVPVPADRTYPVIGSCQYHHTASKPEGLPGYLIGSIAGDHELHVLPATKATFKPKTLDCAAPIAAAIKADRLKARVVWS